jgi:hypothetical protein
LDPLDGTNPFMGEKFAAYKGTEKTVQHSFTDDGKKTSLQILGLFNQTQKKKKKKKKKKYIKYTPVINKSPFIASYKWV